NERFSESFQPFYWPDQGRGNCDFRKADLMRETLRCALKPFLQPFERKLAMLELEAVAKARPRLVKTTAGRPIYAVQTSRTAAHLGRKLAFWERITGVRET